jgi:virginiamycin B lyase
MLRLNWFRSFGLLAAVFGTGFAAVQALPPSKGELVGVVKSADGKPLGGVPVSAKAVGSTITTSVYTDESGRYYFPALPSGKYRMWAQAVGFEFTRVDQTVSSSKKIQQDFALKPFKDIWKQFSDGEWLASLPDGTAEDRRMKKIVLYTCSPCHNSGFLLEKRFDRPDWEIIVNHMSKLSGWSDPPGTGCCGGVPAPNGDDVPGGGKSATPMLDSDGNVIGPERRILEHYKKEIIDYLARVRGPELSPLNLKPFPRPTGEAANVVITEYDVPDKDNRTIGRLDPKTGRVTQYTLNSDGSTARNDEPEYSTNELREGTDWSRGIRSRLYGQHDLVLGKDGFIYLPPEVGVGLDPKGNVWCSFNNEMAISLNVKTEQLSSYPLPAGWPRFANGKDVDSKGYVWGAQPTGFYRLDTNTGKYTEIKAKTQLGRAYGLTIDSEDNVWAAQIAVDKVAYVDGHTGEVGEVVLPPIEDEEITASDRQLGRGWDLGAPLYGKGPRRLRADMRGDSVWVSEFFGGRLAKIDIHTKKVTEYKLPGNYRYANPYEPVVDKNHVVWFSLSNQDALGKFDPVTEKFTFYPMPTRGMSSRHIDVDNGPQVPEIWLPYDQARKVARIQLRTNSAR